MHYSAPEIRTVIIDGGTLRVVWPSRAIDRTTSIGAMEKRIQQYFVDTSPKQLRSHFDIDAQRGHRSRRCVVAHRCDRSASRCGKACHSSSCGSTETA